MYLSKMVRSTIFVKRTSECRHSGQDCSIRRKRKFVQSRKNVLIAVGRIAVMVAAGAQDAKSKMRYRVDFWFKSKGASYEKKIVKILLSGRRK